MVVPGSTSIVTPSIVTFAIFKKLKTINNETQSIAPLQCLY
jgi:hypothetical protein